MVYGLFKDIIPVQVLDQNVRFERGRGTQGFSLTPGLRYHLQLGNHQRDLELKIIGAVPKWYPRNGGLAKKKKAVERRATPSPSEYRNPLANLDTKYHGTPPGQMGPLVRRLEG